MADHPTTPGEIVGRNVRAVRERQLLSQRELAERSGVPKNTIAVVELGKSAHPRRRTIEKLARALDVPVERLLSEEPISPLAEASPSQEKLFNNGILEEERRTRYLKVVQLFATALQEQWASKLERDDFREDEFEHAVNLLNDFEAAFVSGVGTDLLGALQTGTASLPEDERAALDNAKASIDAWHGTMWRACDALQARGPDNVERLDSYRKRLEAPTEDAARAHRAG